MNFLNLPGWEVRSVKESSNDYLVDAAYTVEPSSCVHCKDGSLFAGRLYRHGSRNQTVMDLPSHGKRVGIALKRPRYRCRDCGKTFLQPLPDVDEGTSMTNRLVSYIERESLKRTFVSVAGDVGMDEKTVRNIFRAFVQHLDETVSFVTPAQMGIDEVHLLRKPRCVITNLQERTIVEVLANRNKPTVTAYLRGIEDKEVVKVVAIDMWKPYRDAVRAVLPDAAVVIDKFHVVRMANECLDVVRKSIRKDLTAHQRKKLVRDRYVLLRRPKDLNMEQQLTLSAYLGKFPNLEAAYRLKEAFFGIYDSKDRASAVAAFEAWEQSADDAMKAAFRKLLTAVHNWHTEIFDYFSHRVTNALTEALNGIAKNIQRAGRGYSFDVIRAKMLYTRGLHKRPKYGDERCAAPAEPGAIDDFPHRTELTDETLLGTDIDALLSLLNSPPPQPGPSTDTRRRRSERK